MNDVDLDRCLTMSAYSAFVALSRYLIKDSNLNLPSAINAVRQINSDDAGLDYVGGVNIYELGDLPTDFMDQKANLRTVIFKLITTRRPWWLRLVPYGRDKVRTALGPDQLQCLRAAGLFDTVPGMGVVAWWDELGAIARAEVDTDRMLRAREAEELSMNYERDRLRNLGIDEEPEWVSLEDNTLGYDIRSYDLNDGRIVSRLIEVKSMLSDSIFITRNEWRNAISAEDSYYFHVWKLPERVIAEYRVAVIKSNIPTDQGSGYWEDVRIDLAGNR